MMPSRGMVVVTADDSEEDVHYYHTTAATSDLASTNLRRSNPRQEGEDVLRRKSRKQVQREKAPLRLLVIGDSLAAGVGTRKSPTPVLPESIAHSLSKALGGRPIYWSCTGTPGYTASEIVQEIHHLDPEIEQPALIRRFQEWQEDTKLRAQIRLETSTRKAKEWLEKRGQDAEDTSMIEVTDHVDGNAPTPGSNWGGIGNRIVRWIERRKHQLTRDIHDIKEVIVPPEYAKEVERQVLLRQYTKRRQTNTIQATSIDPDIDGKYDIAVVLTGLNDLKDLALPFMVDRAKRQQRQVLKDSREKQLQQSDSQHEKDVGRHDEDGLKGELLRIIEALKSKMNAASAPIFASSSHSDQDENTHKQQLDICKNLDPKHSHDDINDDNDDDNLHWNDIGPLVVFPALPYAPIELTQWAPLSWFVIPSLRVMDRHKEALAKMYPGLVLFVDSPNEEVISDAEAKRGPLWEGMTSERVHLKVTDITKGAQERILRAMKKHYDNWVKDADEHDKDDRSSEPYELDYFDNVDSNTIIKRRQSDRIGGSMIAPDGIHPNDDGYDMWGKYKI
jgi:hypothetical protein